MTRRAVTAVSVVTVWAVCSAATACAGIGEALIGTCVAATLQVGVELCVDACTGIVCGDDDPPPEPDPPRDEIPPAGVDDGDSDDGVESAVCRLQVDPGGALRLGCADGTSAVVLGEHRGERRYPAAAARTVDGDVVLASADDIAALSGVFAITGSLAVQGDTLLRLRLPSLRRVGGDVVIRDNPRLVRADLSALVDVGGAVRVAGNRVLSADPVPALQRARTIDVVDNDALPVAVVDRLLALLP